MSDVIYGAPGDGVKSRKGCDDAHDESCVSLYPAGHAQVKKKYFQLAKKYHPDQNKDNPDAKAKFQEVTEVHKASLYFIRYHP